MQLNASTMTCVMGEQSRSSFAIYQVMTQCFIFTLIITIIFNNLEKLRFPRSFFKCQPELARRTFSTTPILTLLLDPMVLSVLYVWCQLNKDVIVNFWFGTRFKAMYLPWVLLVFNMVLSGGGISEIIGILVGHLYYFLAYKYPQELGGPALIETPSILREWLPNTIGGVFGRAPEQGPRPLNRGVFRGYQWGRGNVLGGN